MYQDVGRGIKVYQDVSWCITMYQDVSRIIKMYQEYPGMPRLSYHMNDIYNIKLIDI